jgi:hypothetical protein
MTKLASLLLAAALAAPTAAVAEPIIRGNVQVHVDLPKVIIRDRDRTPPRGYIRYDDYSDYDRVERWRGTYDISGTYEGPYGHVYLTQNGNRVTGTYDANGGTGYMKGVIRNNVFYFRWRQAEGEGRGRVYLGNGRARTFQGTWGTFDSMTNAGAWNLTRVGVSRNDRYDRRHYNDRRYRRY